MKLRGSNIRRIKSFFHIQKYLKIHQLQIIKKDKENLQKKKKARERYQYLYEEEKNKKREYGLVRCKNLPENEKHLSIEKNVIKYGKIKPLHK